MSTQLEDGPSPKRQKRSYVACQRCHSHKIKCSGESPCQACLNSSKGDACTFPQRERKVAVSESYLKKLEADVQSLRLLTSKQQSRSESTLGPLEVADEDGLDLSPGDGDVSNPLFETRNGFLADRPSTQPLFVGEAACTAFGDKLLQCVDQTYAVSPPALPRNFQHPLLDRLSSRKYELPDRVHANLVISVALRFIGNDYHLFLKKSFFEELETIYRNDKPQDLVWLCKAFVLLALGELYSSRTRAASPREVPGTGYFLQAIGLLQDLYETPSVTQVEVLLLLSFYSNALGRVKSAYTYTGIAMRLALGLGLHRRLPKNDIIKPIERENRRRVWWTLYILDRISASKLGHPVTISDDDIDVEFPSMDGLSSEEKEDFIDPAHLIANIKLARITGRILSEVYCLPRGNRGTFVQRVHGILKALKAWDEALPSELRLQLDGCPRHVASLHLHYNQCIIQTTRPILLYLFQSQFQLGQRVRADKPPNFSPTTLALAESCVNAARTSNRILSRLFIEGSLATFGFFDANYLFSLTLTLIMSAVMEPNTASSDAVQTSFNLLRFMKDDGNIPAGDYYDRLTHIRASVSNMRAEANRHDEVARTQRRLSKGSRSNLRACKGSSILSETVTGSTPSGGDLMASRYSGVDNIWSGENVGGDALDNPFIDHFLAEKGFSWPSGTSPEGESLRAFAHELEDELLFELL